MIKSNFFTKEQIDEIDSKLYHRGSIIRDPAHKCEITKLWNALHNILVTDGVIAIGEDGYWYVDGEKTEVKAQGEQGIPGEPGKDGTTPALRVSTDGMSLEISNNGGQTWIPFIKDFNKLRVIGYLDSTDKLPKNAKVGDIYGVWNEDANNSVSGTKGAYELYINTVLDWLLDYKITKVYSYDTELPSSATDGIAVIVPVTDLTLDKEKVDGYKVYKYSVANNGWIMVLNTAEIYANKEDIINYGDNVFALVNGAEPNTYELYKRKVGWVYFGTNASITYKLVQDIAEGTETNVPSGKAVKDAIDNVKDRIQLVADGVKVSLSISPSVIYKNENANVVLTGVMENGVPTQMKLLDETTTLNTSSSSPIVHTIQNLNINTDTKSYTVEGITKEVIFVAKANIQARYPIYYGFGSSASSVAIASNKYAATTTASHTYSKRNNADGQHFYILVPSDIVGLTSFTMGGAPFVMTSTTENINGISYKVYTSGNVYNNETEITVVAS